MMTCVPPGTRGAIVGAPAVGATPTAAAWVRGFLSGLGRAGARLGAPGDESQGMLQNLGNIARGATLEEDASAAEEEAYAELVECVALCAEHFYRAHQVMRDVFCAVRGKMRRFQTSPEP